MKPTSSHNYLPIVDKLLKNNGLEHGSLNMCTVAHDDWCDVYAGGYCNCQPIVAIQRNYLDKKKKKKRRR